jgi:RHS repeat-associated protein
VYDQAGNVTSYSTGALPAPTFTYDAENKLINANSGTAAYTYDANGDRVRKDVSPNWTECVRFNGQVLAEEASDGTWSDYIYANGQRIARADNYDIRIHMHGTTCSGSSCPGNEFAGITSFSTASTYTIRQGDVLTWRQYQVGAFGGLLVGFTDLTNLNQVAQDTDGQFIDADQTMNTWHERIVDLSAYAGKTVNGSIIPWMSPTSAPGTWDLYFGDINLVSTDGTSIPLYNRSLASVNGVAASGVTNFSAITEKNLGEPNPLASVTYYSADQIGSTSIVTSAAGWPMSSAIYYPFGQEATQTADNNHYKFTGKERDTESGLDYFGARYLSSSMGRWMSPDVVNVTEDRMMYPSSTLNKYAYGANNPLKYVDPDGQDITIFYESSNAVMGGSPGHTMLLAYNQQNGDSAIRSFGPDYANGATVLGTLVGTPGTDSFGFQNITSPDQLRANFASITIQTTPEEAQAVINEIRQHPDGNYSILSHNCTTTCSRLLRSIGKTRPHSLSPVGFFNELYAEQHGTNTGRAIRSFNMGQDYGNRRPGYDPFQLFFNDIPQQHEKVTSRIVPDSVQPVNNNQ